MSLWYIWRKSCTYLASRLPLSPNGLTVTLCPNGPKWDSTWPTSPSSLVVYIQNEFACLWYVRRKLCTYLAPTLTLSPNRPKQGSTWPTSPRSSIGRIQNDFWAYGIFGAKRAPILRQDYHYLQMDRQWHCLRMDQNEIPHDPRHLAVSLGASKMIS
jgi:hypothetical protein